MPEPADPPVPSTTGPTPVPGETPAPGPRPALPAVEVADQLRASIDLVRRQLDEVDRTLGHTAGQGSPMVRADHRRPRPKTWLVLLVTLLVIAGSLGAAALAYHRGHDAPIRTDPIRSDPIRTGPKRTLGSAPSPPVAVRPARDWPGTGTGLPVGPAAAGPGVTQPGDDVTVTPGEGGALEVYERILLPAPGWTGIRLVSPDLSTHPTLSLGNNIWVRDLEVTVDGRVARVVWGQNGWTIRSGTAGLRYRRVVVRFRLANAVQRRQPAAAGRDLLVVTPLWATQAALLHYPVEVRADRRVDVRNATCPRITAGDQLCGSPIAGGYVGRIPPAGTLPLVLLQVDLPKG